MSAALLLSALCAACPGEAAAESWWRINDIAPSARVHLREEPSNHSDVLAYIPGDTRGLKGGRCEGNWCEIEFRGMKGWVFRDYIEPDETPQEREAKAGEPPAAPPPQEIRPQAPAASASSLTPEELEQKPSFRLVGKAGGGTITVYAFPSETMRVAGLLPGSTASVDGMGTCVQSWCYIKAGSLIGWIRTEEIALDDAPAPADLQPTAAVSPAALPPPDERTMLNKTVPTATNAAAPLPPPEPLAQSGPNGAKTYVLAGLAGQSSLPMRAEPEDTARILEWIPGDARDVEGLRKCVEQWCLVHYKAAEGWVERRYLADASLAQTQTFQVSGLPLWNPLKVLDQPASGANVVGEIPSYATGIVPIGNCDRSWCHIRYLGVAGWVSSQNLEPQKR